MDRVSRCMPYSTYDGLVAQPSSLGIGQVSSYGGARGVLVAVRAIGTLARGAPTRRAPRISPTEALRQE
jgi:hypothetical protein